MGGDGGFFEAVVCDNSNPSLPVFYLTEDHEFGALRRYIPPVKSNGFAANWNSLHEDGGNMEYLVFLSDNTFTWSCDIDAARLSQSLYFPNVEGIDYQDGKWSKVHLRF